MRTPILIAVLILCLAGQAAAQKDSIGKKKIYKAWLNLNKEPSKQKGVLYEIRDSSVVLSDSKHKADYHTGNFKITSIDAGAIDKIKLRSKGRVNRSALIGFGAGFVAGGLAGALMMGSLSQQESTAGFIFVASWAGALGAAIGAIIGSIKISIPIGGDLIRFNASKKMLNSYAMLNNQAIINSPGLTSLSGYFSRLGLTVKDTDGNVYHTLALAGQVWLEGDLRVTHYCNGDVIPLVNNKEVWKNTVSGASCQYGNDSAKTEPENMLYNLDAVSDHRGLCPKNWHIPSYEEWSSLVVCLGGGPSAGKKLTEPVPAVNGSLSDDPFALPGRFRYANGEYSSSKGLSYQWWSSTPADSLTGKAFYMGNADGGIMFTNTDKRSGLPVRCLRD